MTTPAIISHPSPLQFNTLSIFRHSIQYLSKLAGGLFGARSGPSQPPILMSTTDSPIGYIMPERCLHLPDIVDDTMPPTSF